LQSYGWFKETFASTITRSRAQIALVNCIEDIIGNLIAENLLSGQSEGRLTQEKNDLERVKEVFRLIDSRPRDVDLIHTFQKSIHQSDPKVARVLLRASRSAMGAFFFF
jgi:hypothetical protein